jgi:hypothetical protein
MRRSGPPVRKTPLERRGELARKPAKRKVPRRVPARAPAAAAFHAAVLVESCIVCAALVELGLRDVVPVRPLEAHHAVPAQALRRIARSLGLGDVETAAVVYDPAIGVPLCVDHHGGHTSKLDPVSRHLLPERVFVAAAELDVEATIALEREHPDLEGCWP